MSWEIKSNRPIDTVRQIDAMKIWMQSVMENYADF